MVSKTPRVSKKAAAIDIKCSLEKPDAHVSFHKNEWKLAGYLGCATLGGFRKLRFSPALLKWYPVFYRKCRHTSPLNALSLLRDIDNIPGTFPNTLEELMEKFPIIENPGNNRSTKIVNNDHVDYIYAGVISWLAV